jgi:sugar phosphate isomerase/epimerase
MAGEAVRDGRKTVPNSFATKACVMKMERRAFLQSSLALAALPLTGLHSAVVAADATAASENRFRISLNAYSFNAPLLSGKTTLPAVLDFCAAQGFDAVDLTGYYFPGYPATPPDEYVYQLKRKARRLGLGISGTGIRNELGQTDATARAGEIALVKRWIEVAAKLSAPVLRIYTGKAQPEKTVWSATADRMIEDIKTCVAYGKARGVMVAIQNHNDFIKTADQALDFMKRVDDEWFGLVLDTGNFVTNEAYGEIAKASLYAVNWQVKEKIDYPGKSENMDLLKLFRIIKASPYRGYLPIETLSPGDPFAIIPPFFKQVKDAMARAMKS